MFLNKKAPKMDYLKLKSPLNDYLTVLSTLAVKLEYDIANAKPALSSEDHIYEIDRLTKYHQLILCLQSAQQKIVISKYCPWIPTALEWHQKELIEIYYFIECHIDTKFTEEEVSILNYLINWHNYNLNALTNKIKGE